MFRSLVIVAGSFLLACGTDPPPTATSPSPATAQPTAAANVTPPTAAPSAPAVETAPDALVTDAGAGVTAPVKR